MFKGIATHVIVDCIMSMEQFWEYLTVMGPEGGTVTTCLSHAQMGKQTWTSMMLSGKPNPCPLHPVSLGPLG